MYNAAPIFFLYPSPLMRHSVQVSDLSVVCTGQSIIFHLSQTNDDRIAKQKSNSFPPRSSFLNPRFSLQIHDNQIQHHPPPMASIFLLFLVRECQFAQLQRQPLTPHSTQDISMMAILIFSVLTTNPKCSLFIIQIGGQQTVACGLHLAGFFKLMFYGTQPCQFIYLLSMAHFMLQQQS